MLIVLSPSKSLDFKKPITFPEFSLPELLNESEKLMGKLKKLTPKQISAFMNISPALGELNFQRFQSWELPFTPENSRQALFAFNGDVYQGLDAGSLSVQAVKSAQKKVRILSGLYGVLKPLDLIQPYRLEMGTAFGYYSKKNLYEFWKSTITGNIRKALNDSESNVLVNLASNEYFKSIDLKKLKAEVVTPAFLDFKNGKYRMISFFAKRARGLMTRFILENQIDESSALQAFEAEGYVFNPALSKAGNPVFTRG